MGEDCSERRKEASGQPERGRDEFLDKRQSESVVLGAGKWLPCASLPHCSVTVRFRNGSLCVTIHN